MDGVRLNYPDMLQVVLEALEYGEDVRVDTHWGVDVYWIYHEAPSWADRVTLEDEGIARNGRIFCLFQ